MSDRMQDRSETDMMGPLVGFALGAVVGGVVALLLAPASGEQTRRKLGRAARRLGRDARQSFDEARVAVGDAASELEDGVKAAVVAGRDRLQQDDSR